VYPTPKVGVLSTGDELKEVGEELNFGQIYDSNRPMLLAALTQHNCEAIDAGIAPDTDDALLNVIKSALESVDILITSGGVSMGNKDLLKAILEV